MWVAAAIAAGTYYRGAAALALFKPSLFPFALIGAHDRSWWIVVASMAAVSVPFGAMWIDWLRVVVNASDGGLLHSSLQVGLPFLPLIAWLGRTAETPAQRRSSSSTS